MNRHLISKPLLLCALALGLFSNAGCGGGPARSRTAEVRVVKPVRGALEASFLASGRVQAKTVKLASGEHGRLVSLLVKVGDRVRKGQVVARMDDSEQKARLRVAQADLQKALHGSSEAREDLQAKRSEIAAEVAKAQASRGEAYSRYRDVASGGPREERTRAQAHLDGAQAKYNLAVLELKRQRNLFKEDIVSPAQLEKTQAELAQAQAQRDQARAELEKLQRMPRRETVDVAHSEVVSADVKVSAAQASGHDLGGYEARIQAAQATIEKLQGEMDSTRLALERTGVRAPCDGIVANLLVEPGEMVKEDAQILAIQKDGPLWIEAELDEQDTSLVQAGQSVDITLQGKPYHGKVEEVAPALEQRSNSPGDSKVLKIKVTFIDKVAGLRPGLHADVQGHSSLAANELTVPSAAVKNEAGQNFVYTVSEGVLHKIQVSLGEHTADQTAIRQGLKEDAMVVVEGAESLSEGAAVRVRQ